MKVKATDNGSNVHVYYDNGTEMERVRELTYKASVYGERLNMRYIIHQKSSYTDGTGLVLALANSKQKGINYIRKNHPGFEYDSSQDSRDQRVWENAETCELICLEKYESDILIL